MHSSDEVFGSFPPFLCSTFPQYSLAPWLQRYSACLLIELPPIIVFSPPSPSRMQWLLSSMVVSDVHVSTASSLAIFFFSIQLHINTSLFFGEAFFPPPLLSYCSYFIPFFSCPGKQVLSAAVAEAERFVQGEGRHGQKANNS